MIKLFCGSEIVLIKQEIKQITQQWGNTIIFNPDDSFEKLENELTTYSLFNHHKNLVIFNPHWIKTPQIEELFLNLLAQGQANDEIILVLTEVDFKKTLLYNFVKNKGQIKIFNALTERELMQFIQNYVTNKGGKITHASTYLLVDHLPHNLALLQQELDKLLLHNLHIKPEAIKTMVANYAKDDFFALTNALVSHDINHILQAWTAKIKLGTSNMVILSQMASVFSLAARIYFLQQMGFNNQKISTKLKLHPFRLKKIQQLIYQFSVHQIKQLLKLIATSEFMIKKGLQAENVVMQNLLLQIIR